MRRRRRKNQIYWAPIMMKIDLMTMMVEVQFQRNARILRHLQSYQNELRVQMLVVEEEAEDVLLHPFLPHCQCLLIPQAPAQASAVLILQMHQDGLQEDLNKS